MRLSLLVSILGLAAGCTTSLSQVEDLPGARNDAYRAASAKYGVSEEWLVALGYQQGRFESAQGVDSSPDPLIDLANPAVNLLADVAADPDPNDPGTADPSQDVEAPPTWGLMYLTDAQVARAATLTGHTADAVQSDIASNIDGAAAILAADAQAMGLRDATTAFIGVQSDAAALALNDLDTDLSVGFDITTDDGERIALVGDGAPVAALPISPDTEDGGIAPATSSSSVKPGQMPPFQWIASPNFGSRDGDAIRYVIVHDMEGFMPGSIAIFQNPATEVSAHYLVRSSDGHIVKMVYEHDDAWHCGHGWFNRHSIGIEHEGFAHKKDGGGYYTAKMYAASAQLTCSIAVRYNIPVDRKHIFGHLNVPSNLDSTTICSDAEGIAGKCGGVDHHTDPGEYWNWTKYMSLVSDCVAAAKK